MPDAKPPTDVEWYERTNHCGRCGQPGAYCLCTARNPCGCQELHVVGSGLEADAVEQFAEPISTDQTELF